MSESMALVAVDAHQAQSVAAVLDPLNGEVRVERLHGAPAVVVAELVAGLKRPVRAVYELEVRVIAPGSVPRAPGDWVKTDRRDATRLARLFAAGELSFSFVPSEDEQRLAIWCAASMTRARI